MRMSAANDSWSCTSCFHCKWDVFSLLCDFCQKASDFDFNLNPVDVDFLCSSVSPPWFPAVPICLRMRPLSPSLLEELLMPKSNGYLEESLHSYLILSNLSYFSMNLFIEFYDWSYIDKFVLWCFWYTYLWAS